MFPLYNEPETMRQYALAQEAPDEDTVLDYAGRRTYDTCYRTEHIFGSEETILVTQWRAIAPFLPGLLRLDRALYTCSGAGGKSCPLSR
jgi:vancomycin permeability regulator SanA